MKNFVVMLIISACSFLIMLKALAPIPLTPMINPEPSWMGISQDQPEILIGPVEQSYMEEAIESIRKNAKKRIKASLKAMESRRKADEENNDRSTCCGSISLLRKHGFPRQAYLVQKDTLAGRGIILLSAGTFQIRYRTHPNQRYSNHVNYNDNSVKIFISKADAERYIESEKAKIAKWDIGKI